MADDRTAQVARAWTLRQDGRTVREIADDLGVSVGTAHARVREAAEAEIVVGGDDRSTARIREAATLDAWQAKVEPLLDEDPLTAVPVLLRVSKARRELLGLDMPTKISISDERNPVTLNPEVVASVRAAHERAARERARRRGEDIPPEDEITAQVEAAERDAARRQARIRGEDAPDDGTEAA